MFATPRRLASLVAALTLASAPAALADSGMKCADGGSYGKSCIEIKGRGLKLKDIQGYFEPPSRAYLADERWALELTQYSCDPRGQTVGHCPFDKRWFTKLHKHNAAPDGQFCTQFAPEGVGYQDCVDRGLAYADAHRGDWRGFYDLQHPYTFAENVWFCTDLVTRAHHRWYRNGAAGTPGVRACAEVHA